MFATAAIAVVIGVLLCGIIVGYAIRGLGLPFREAMMWFGLLELEVSAPPRAIEGRRS